METIINPVILFRSSLKTKIILYLFDWIEDSLKWVNVKL